MKVAFMGCSGRRDEIAEAHAFAPTDGEVQANLLCELRPSTSSADGALI